MRVDVGLEHNIVKNGGEGGRRRGKTCSPVIEPRVTLELNTAQNMGRFNAPSGVDNKL